MYICITLAVNQNRKKKFSPQKKGLDLFCFYNFLIIIILNYIHKYYILKQKNNTLKKW